MEQQDKRLLISIHDVAPRTWPLARAIAEWLDSAGHRPYSLFVVPDYRGDGPITAHPDFLEWVKGSLSAGNDVLVHGLQHLSRSPAANAGEWIMKHLYTREESEFLSLGEEEFLRRLSSGAEIFRAAGLPVRGFVAPAWLMPHGSPAWLARAGIEVSETLREILLVQTGRVLFSPCLAMSSRTAVRRIASICWAFLFLNANYGHSSIRVAIHPQDWKRKCCAAILRKVIAVLSQDRRLITYADLLEETT